MNTLSHLATMRPSAGTLDITGGKALHGEIKIRGAKNSVPKSMVAALLSSERTILTNVSGIRDVEIMEEMIRTMGGEVSHDAKAGSLSISSPNLSLLNEAQMKIFSGISRIPILLCGPMLHRFQRVFVPELGGCAIGERPIDFHLAALRQFGATIEEVSDGLWLTAPRRLRGTRIRLDYPSVGATEQIVLTAVLAEGETELSNAAMEPEILDLVCQLQKMGATIFVDTDRVIRVEGVSKLRGCTHDAMPDRLEAASWAMAAVATSGKITVTGARQADMVTFLNVFRRLGGEFEATSTGITFFRKSDRLRPVIMETNVHPGYMTDWQQPLATVLTQAAGVSIIHETVYEGRFGYVATLNDMGGNITLHRDCLGSRCRFGRLNHYHSAVIVGPTPLLGRDIRIPDLRGGFSYVIAALSASGKSRISNISLINRGYEDFPQKLDQLGAQAQWSGG